MPNEKPTPEAPGQTEGPADLVKALADVLDPELGAPLVELGMIPSVSLDELGVATIRVGLTTAACPMRGRISDELRAALADIEAVRSVVIETVELDEAAKSKVMARARYLARASEMPTSLPAGVQVIAIGSGKGGVGKSSVTVNTATALAALGFSVGIIDADISGFSIPRLLGASANIEAKGGKMLPVEVGVGEHSLRVLSMGFLAEEDRAVMWRGLLLARAVQQFIEDADWSGIDYLLVDLPPGTSDVQMALGRIVPSARLLLVTTPPSAAAHVAIRTADMANKGYLKVVGVVENMSPFTCEHGSRYALFGEGGGQMVADRLGLPLVASIPLHPEVADGGDVGLPVALGEGPIAEAFAQLAERIVSELAPPPAMEGCSARLLAAVEAAVAQA